MLASFLPAIAKLIVAQPISDQSLATTVSGDPCCVVDVRHGACPFVMVCHSNQTQSVQQPSASLRFFSQIRTAVPSFNSSALLLRFA